ncbi:hypothetical protein [Microbispora sp. NPDC046933]|uniref:hypothetical protein n=1 Tax=Microbispora sp. NPDC046933 TaxID=3155618 RepID=UPI0033C511BB
MTVKITISLPDDLHEEIKAITDQSGESVSGFFAALARTRLDADRWSREQLKAELDAIRAADPEGFDRQRAALRARMRAALESAGRKAAARAAGSNGAGSNSA